MGVKIPDRLVTPTIRMTDWRMEPIHSTADINAKWIGSKVSQVSPALIRVIWNIETELELIKRQTAAKQNAQETANAEGDDRYISRHLLGDLRYLFLLNCLLSNASTVGP
jgi:hypothetical protein